MAEVELKRIYLRPSADISIEHGLYPAESTSAYSLINEEINDGSATYISHTFDANDATTWSKTSSFVFSASQNMPSSDLYKIKQAFFYTDEGTNVELTAATLENYCIEVTIRIDDNNVITIDNVNGGVYFTNLINISSFPQSVSVTVTTKCDSCTAGSKSSTTTRLLTQLYIEIVYETHIRRKVNDVIGWRVADIVYQKINNTWTQIDNYYEPLQSKLIAKGHHQEYIPAVAPTCTETGLAVGYKCSICGEFIVPQEVVAATGHSYTTSGCHVVCEECGYIDGIGHADLVYHGTTTELSQSRGSLAATTVGNYALFGGGYGGYNVTSSSYIYYSTVDAYNQSLTRTIPTELSQSRGSLAATTVGDYALFGGGNNNDDDNTVYHSTVDAYKLQPI